MRVAVQLERGGVPYVIDSLLLDCLILPLEGILQSSYYYKLATAVSFFSRPSQLVKRYLRHAAVVFTARGWGSWETDMLMQPYVNYN